MKQISKKEAIRRERIDRDYRIKCHKIIYKNLFNDFIGKEDWDNEIQ